MHPKIRSVNRLSAGAVLYHAVGQPTISRIVHIPCSRSTDCWRRWKIAQIRLTGSRRSKGLTPCDYVWYHGRVAKVQGSDASDPGLITWSDFFNVIN